MDQDLTERATHLLARVSDLAACHIFFAVQVVEISTDLVCVDPLQEE